MLSERTNNALNRQLSLEFGATQPYMAISICFAKAGYPVIAHCFRKQWRYKINCGESLVDYIVNHGGTVALDYELAAAPNLKRGATPTEIFDSVLMYETQLIDGMNEICALAMEEKDFATFGHILHIIQNAQLRLNKLARVSQKIKSGDDDKRILDSLELEYRIYSHRSGECLFDTDHHEHKKHSHHGYENHHHDLPEAFLADEYCYEK